MILCEYRLHAFNQRQREAADRQQQQLLAIGIGFLAILPVIALGYWSLQRERRRDPTVKGAGPAAGPEHAGAVALQEGRWPGRTPSGLAPGNEVATLRQHRHHGRIVRAQHQESAGSSQRSLLACCVDADGIPPPQRTMLGEVRDTLGTVTERLQQILRTVRRDPSRAELTRLDLNDLLAETARTWEDLAREKWKLTLTCIPAAEPLLIDGDVSHLQQAIENLLFNARDATFEMRNHLRDEARRDPARPNDDRRKALIDAAGWRGKVELRAKPRVATERCWK